MMVVKEITWFTLFTEVTVRLEEYEVLAEDTEVRVDMAGRMGEEETFQQFLNIFLFVGLKSLSEQAIWDFLEWFS